MGAIETAYGVSSTVIGSMGYMYMLIFIPVNFPSNYVLDAKGLRVGVSALLLTSEYIRLPSVCF